MKLSNITTLHKKGRKENKENYRPVRILSPLFKIWERTHSVCFNNILSDQQCGFRKGCSTQHFLLNLLEKWKSSLDKVKSFGALLIYIQISHRYLIVSILKCSLQNTLRLLHYDAAIQKNLDYLWNRKQKIKIYDNYSSWSELLFGVRQGSILESTSF